MTLSLQFIIVSLIAWAVFYRKTGPSKVENKVTDAIVIALIAIRIWLGDTSPIYAIPVAPIDDGLFIRAANSILKGEWLGSYDFLTLSKGPFFSIYLASLSFLKIPLIAANSLSYGLSAWLLLAALRQEQNKIRWWMQTISFSVLLFCPTLIDSETAFRVFRQPLWIALCIAVLGTSAGVYTCNPKNGTTRILWTAGLGSALGLAWITREEAIWLLVPTFFFASLTVISDLKGKSGWLSIVTYCAPLALAPLIVAAVSWKNYQTYGYFGVVELRDANFLRAYGALTRVAPFDHDRRIPVTREAREIIYEISPSFRELKPFIENGPGQATMKFTEDHYGISANEREIGGAFMLWVLREAVQLSGNSQSHESSSLFYRNLASEIDKSCESNATQSTRNRQAIMPPLDIVSQLPSIIDATSQSLKRCFDYTVQLKPNASIGSLPKLETVTKLTNQPNTSTLPEIAKTQANPLKILIWSHITNIYNYIIKPTNYLSIIFFSLQLARNVNSRTKPSNEILIAFGALLGLFASSTIVALIHVTSWNAIKLEYLGVSTCFSLALTSSLIIYINRALIDRKPIASILQTEHS